MIEINHIYCEDYRQTVSRIGQGQVDIVFTSPPYNRKRNDTYAHHDDIILDYLGFLIETTDILLSITPTVFLNIQSNFYNKQDIFKYLGHYAELISQTFIWSKENPTPAQGKNITNAFEYIFMLGENKPSNTTYTKNHIHTLAVVPVPMKGS